jgi:hypothetical protein
MTMVRFDEALDVAIKAIRVQLEGRTGSITLVRDVAGQLTAILDDDAIPAAPRRSSMTWSSSQCSIGPRMAASTRPTSFG